MEIILIVLYLALLIWLTYESVNHLGTTKRLILKQICSAFFIGIFIYFIFKHNYNFNNYIGLLIGFIMSFLGDLLLGFYNHNKFNNLITFFYIGTALFFAAQLAFIYQFAFVNKIGFNIFYVVIPIVVVIALIIIFEGMHVRNKKIIAISSFYGFAVSSMLVSTLLYTLNGGSILVLLGGLFFILSDFTLTIKYFNKKAKSKFLTILTTVTYYVAQLLFAIFIW